MSKYFAQPQYALHTVTVYSIPFSPVAKLNPSTEIAALIGPSADYGPNSVFVYEDFSGASGGPPARYLLIAYTFSSGNGAVCVFDLKDIDLTGDKPAQTLGSSLVTLSVADNPIGMAIRPGTGDLYVATDGMADGNATITVFPKVSGGAWSSSSTTFASFAQPFGFASTAANLAFDQHGNLWMTSLGAYEGVSYQYLTCYTGIVSYEPQNTPYVVFVNGAALTNVAALQGVKVASMFPLSCPEGIAFDPAGNLWVANNNAESTVQNLNSAGSLSMISADWLLSQLYPAPVFPADGIPNGVQISNTTAFPAACVPYYINGLSNPGGIFFDGWTMYINDEGNETVWELPFSGGKPGTVSATTAATTNPGNGTMAVFNDTPSELLIADGSWDTGTEPDTLPAGDQAWESSDIGITATPLADLTDVTQALSGQVDFGSLTDDTAYVYVRVTNISTTSSNGGETLKVYWAKASTALDWPAPWDGSVSTTGTPAEVLGGLVGTSTLAPLNAGQAVILQVTWANVPAPLSFAGDPDQAHFCLLARIEGNPMYPFGMTWPEEWTYNSNLALTYNVLQNRGVAWRNILITEVGATGDIKFLGILGGNLGLIDRVIGFEAQTIGRSGKIEPIPAKVHITANGAALERLLKADFDPKQCEHLGKGRFHLHDIEKGLRGIRMRAGETLPFTVEFMPEERVENFAVRVIQRGEAGGQEEVTGGQTFVFGEVEGFPVRNRKR